MMRYILLTIILSSILLSGCSDGSSSGNAHATGLSPTKAETLIGSWEITRYVGISPTSQGYILKDEMRVYADGSCTLLDSYGNGSRLSSWTNEYATWEYNDVAECSVLSDEFLQIKSPLTDMGPYYIVQRSNDKFVIPDLGMILERITE